jgi:hypothetical protein
VSNGLLIGGHYVPVEGVRVLGPGDAPWIKLGPGDGKPRDRRDIAGKLLAPQQWFLHKTIADDPEKVLPGVGPAARAGGAEDTVETWAKDPTYSAAQLVSGHDGELVQIADLLFVETFHATVSNAYSVGIETKEMPGGGFFEAAAFTTVAATIVGCDALGIQKQMPKLGSYRNRPITRMVNGGHDCVGVFGHRDNTDRRGRWDPGDYLFQLLAAHGFEQFDYEAGEDIATWKARQLALNAQLGIKLTVDGIPGPATRAALVAAGYKNGIYANGR